MWQLLLIFYFIFGTTSHLLRRILAQKLGDHIFLINAVFFLFFLLPTTIVLIPFFPHNLNVGLLNLFLLLGGSIIWPILAIISFSANRKVDVGIFTIINNLSPLFTLAIALPLLHENLSTSQLIGISLLILSGILAASSQLHKGNRTSLESIFVCLLSAVVLGIAVAYERFMLSRVEFGAYLTYGWGAQITWSAILAGKELRKILRLFNRDAETRQNLVVYGSAKALAAVAFILALKTNGSASVISATTDFMSVTVLVAAYFYLKERQHMVYKWLAATVGIAGLLLIAK